MNAFDAIQRGTWEIVARTMGYDGTWSPADGSSAQPARVLLKEPTKEYELGGVNYTPLTFIAEYFQPDWAGLYESVSAGGAETVTINSVDYYVAHVTAINDGKNYRAVLQRVS